MIWRIYIYRVLYVYRVLEDLYVFNYRMDEFIDMNEEDALAEINLEATQLEEQQSETHSGESAQAQRKRRKKGRFCISGDNYLCKIIIIFVKSF